MNDPALGIAIGPLRRACEQEPVKINFETWSKYPSIRPVAGEPITALTRCDLLDTAKAIEWSTGDNTQDHHIAHLFVRTMMWGSGTTNGRGPRYTERALASEKVPNVLRVAHEHLTREQIAEAYDLHRQLPGVGPAFFTKLLWVLGKQAEVSPLPLIMDARVWTSLNALRWDSRTASGSRRWGDRYVAYLRACERWGGSRYSAEDVEYTLFSTA